VQAKSDFSKKKEEEKEKITNDLDSAIIIRRSFSYTKNSCF
jgi:hypothetical protein